MKLKNLLICDILNNTLEPIEKQHLKRLENEAKNAKICVNYIDLLTQNDICNLNTIFQANNTLIICGSDEEMNYALKNSLFAVGYDTHTGSHIILGFEEVTPDYLNKTLLRFLHLPWTICETKRLLIREATENDLDALYSIYNSSPDITQFIEPLYEDREKELEFQRAYIENMYGMYGFGLWVIVHKESGQLIGRAGIEIREINNSIEAEVAYVFSKEYQGMGLAYEAMEGIIEYAWKNTEYDHLNCYTQEENTKSVALCTALGFKYVNNETIFYCGRDTVFRKYVLQFSDHCAIIHE